MELGGSKTATKSPTWPCDPIAGKKNNRTPDRESCFCGENTIVSLALSRAFNESFVDSIQKLLENNEYQGTTGCVLSILFIIIIFQVHNFVSL